MVRARLPRERTVEELLAELTAAAYGVALRHGIKDSFVDVELEIWQALRAVLQQAPRHPEPIEG